MVAKCTLHRHHPHHSLSSFSFWDANLELLRASLRIYGFEGEVGQEGEGWTRVPESSRRREGVL